jgi:TIR domain
MRPAQKTKAASRKPAQPQRDLIFISHAAPEDNDVAVWLTAHLAREGYHVWCDLPRLLGGERFWAEIETRIRDEAAKVLYILSKTSNGDSDRGFRKELHLADSESKRHLANGSKDFLIPIAVDDLRSADYNVYVHQRNATPFQDGWAVGFAKLLKKLRQDKVPKRMPKGGSQFVSDWWGKFRSSSAGVKTSPTDFLSNWFPVTSLPETVYIFKLADVTGQKVSRIEYDLRFPAGQHGDFIMAFSPELQEQLPSNLSASAMGQLFVDDVLSGKAVTADLDGKTLKNTLLSLLRVAWEKWVLSDKTQSFQLANRRLCAYFPKPEDGDLKGYFIGVDGKRSWRGLTGNWTTKSRLNPEAARKRYWHFGIQAQPKAYPKLMYVISSHVLFSDDGREIWSDQGRMHQARRSRCKNWYNEVWRDRLRAAIGLLSSEQPSIRIPAANGQFILVGTQAIMFQSKLSFDVLADKSKSKPEVILAEKEEYEADERENSDDDDYDDDLEESESSDLGVEAAEPK